MRFRALVACLALAAQCAASACGHRLPAMPLAYVGADNQVYVASAEGGSPTRISGMNLAPPKDAQHVTYQWPTWSPGGQWLAYLRFWSASDESEHAAVMVARSNGAGERVIFEMGPGDSAMFPFYLSWSPDATQLALGAQQNRSVHLLILDPTSSHPAADLTSASPVFYSWAPDSRSLLVHPDGDWHTNPAAEVSLIHLGQVWDDRFVLPARPNGFHAPAWSPDGSRAVVAATDDTGHEQLVAFDTASGAARTLLNVDRAPLFTWSPDGAHLALGANRDDEAAFFKALDVLTLSSGARQTVAVGKIAAFYWSPDGSRIAYAEFRGPEAPGVAWWVVGAGGEGRVKLVSLVPDHDSFFQMLFFDQYAQSMSPWSPDGRWLTLSGSLEGSPAGHGHVYVVATDGVSEPRLVADGQMPAWPISR